MKKKILITGGSGLLAINWASSISHIFDVVLLLHRREISLEGVLAVSANLDNLKECQSVLIKYQPEIVVHAAGMTNVEKCQLNPDLAKKVNIELTKNVAVACHEQGVKLVYISTDHIFTGNKMLVSEEEKGNPLNYYAESKFLGEQQVKKHCKDALIIRTNFFGWGTEYRHSFSDTIIDKLRHGKSIKLFQDVFFTPILTTELISKVHQLLEIKASGVFNIVGNERLSKYEFGLMLADCFNLDTSLINAVSIKEMPNLEKRPSDMSLSNEKLHKILHCKIPSITEQFQILKDQEDIRKKVNVEIIPYGRHYIDESDVESVVDVLRNGMLTQGPKVAEFEEKIANYVGAKYAVAVSSATAALHLSSIVLELEEGDQVITTPNTFVATSNSILYVGAEPVFVDIDSKTLNIDISKIEQEIKDSKNVSAIYPVHFAGLPCDMKNIKVLANKYSLSVVEDASHALGSTYEDGSRVGNCKYSDLTVFSFHPVKGIAAGEGGVITTNNPALYHKLNLLRSHGISKGNFEFPGVSVADNFLVNKNEALENGLLKRWYYEMQYLGYNYRITDIQCALAISQLNKIEKFIEARKELVRSYDAAFESVPFVEPYQKHNRNNSSHHIYTVCIDFNNLGLSRNQFMSKLADKGVGSQVHYIPIVMQPFYQDMGYQLEKFSVSRAYYENTLSLPLYFGLTRAQQSLVIESIKELIC